MSKPIVSLLLVVISACILRSQAITFDHHALLVKDLAESATFYQDIIGLTEIEDKTGKDHIRWFSLGNGGELHLIQKEDFVPVDEIGVHFALRAKDLDVFIAHMKATKTYFKNWLGLGMQANTRPDGIRQIYLRDPNGYWIEVNGI